MACKFILHTQRGAEVTVTARDTNQAVFTCVPCLSQHELQVQPVIYKGLFWRYNIELAHVGDHPAFPRQGSSALPLIEIRIAL
eukprot:44913-Pleurochrysis_carterae.AAC.1